MEWTLIVGACVLATVLLVAYRIGYSRGWSARDLKLWREEGKRLQDFRKGKDNN